jgi:DNA-binding beta-propeller fold protein YncE
MQRKDAMNRHLIALVLVMAAPLLLFGQATSELPTPAAIAGAKHRLLMITSAQQRLLRVSPMPRQKACEPGPVQPVIAYPGYFESVIVANNGDVYTSDQVTMGVYRITPRGQVTLFASLFGGAFYDPQALYAGTLGLEFDRHGNLWIAALDFLHTERHGIYMVTPEGRSELAVPMDPAVIPVPNSLIFDDRGNLYVTESYTGTIWKVARGEHVATPWLTHELLTPGPGGQFGANGIIYKDNTLIVVSTDRGLLLKVPLNRDGSPGEVTVFAQLLDPLGVTLGPDGLAFGPDGAVYATCAYAGQFVRVEDDGTWEVVLDQDLGYPTGAAFAKTRGERDTVYLANFLSPLNFGPSVVKVDLCKPKCGRE